MDNEAQRESQEPQGTTPQQAGPQRSTAVVLCAVDAARLGELAAQLRDRGLAVAICVGEPDAEAIAEMVGELYPTGA